MDAIKSTKFEKVRTYQNNQKPTFAEVRKEDLDICQKAYFDNLHYYNLILKNKDLIL